MPMCVCTLVARSCPQERRHGGPPRGGGGGGGYGRGHSLFYTLLCTITHSFFLYSYVIHIGYEGKMCCFAKLAALNFCVASVLFLFCICIVDTAHLSMPYKTKIYMYIFVVWAIARGGGGGGYNDDYYRGGGYDNGIVPHCL
jgi:hypothetical protein